MTLISASKRDCKVTLMNMQIQNTAFTHSEMTAHSKVVMVYVCRAQQQVNNYPKVYKHPGDDTTNPWK